MIAVRRKIGIVGAAISGPTLALQILTHPVLRELYTPTLWDQTPDPFPSSCHPTSPFSPSSPSAKTLQTAGAAIALSGNGLAPLYALGLRAAIDARSQEFTGVSFWRSGYGAPAFSPDEAVEAAQPAPAVRLNRMQDPTWSTELGTNMRIIERRHLQEILLKKVVELDGEVVWERKLEKVEEVGDTGGVRVLFKGGKGENVSLLVGAEGAWSEVRRAILRRRDESTAEERWVPDFMGATGIYGISSPKIAPLVVEGVEKEAAADTHGIWLDQGTLSMSPLPGGKIRWDLLIPEASPPEHSKSKAEEEIDAEVEQDMISRWESRIVPNAYSTNSTIDILHRHAGVYHPATSSFGRLIAASERIIRSPLRSSFGVEDATVLANCLLNHSPSAESNFRTALEEYAQVRISRSKKMARMASLAGNLSLGERWYWRWLRDYGIKWMPMPKDPKAGKK
ncbi:FAD/NAD(P)-binding domain-containing protein [Mytilinidion resinicola]|uniref:FAD/NAD(P)-binding domain-containing protein n=1 Tax=Mytilinidion resinicola TaxID=574789 RepID=A0A6A6YRM9_9PEZI|nr:FAD/NAD(P)-binding domain-containing protein [Mytilinidion resinicola]KAF2811592.1 FAD/NAD(P)-binding domain-containing protein [Mytilinidion resinicola]